MRRQQGGALLKFLGLISPVIALFVSISQLMGVLGCSVNTSESWCHRIVNVNIFKKQLEESPGNKSPDFIPPAASANPTNSAYRGAGVEGNVIDPSDYSSYNTTRDRLTDLQPPVFFQNDPVDTYYLWEDVNPIVEYIVSDLPPRR
ncbi:hypothetical protein TI04_05940 [Achromatium sp. WMS2]|nr:hypothetical protein TI04_05940 [Achromatium sp. WMS2]